jgi:tellurite resistance protein
LTAAGASSTVGAMARPPSEVAERARALFARKVENDERLRGPRRPGAASSADDFFVALIEGAFLVAAADGELDAEEAATFVETLAYVTGAPVAPEEFMALVDRFAEARGRDGVKARLATLAASVPDAAARREIVAFAALLGLCDRRLAPAERATLSELARVLELGADEGEALLRETEGALAGP